MKNTILFLLMLYARAAGAQHHMHHGHIHGSDSSAATPMSHAFSLNLPMSRNGSGTGWLPDSTPMYGHMFHSKKWMYMLHGNVFVRYNRQDVLNAGTRGGKKFDSVNWFMFMGQRKTGSKGLLRFSSMLSLDRLFGGNGYPLLFQTGESWQGQPLVDRQHPHDLVSELSVAYTHAFNQNTDAYVYLGYPGEPALGSVAFMHRVSSLYNPDAPLSHHWNDGTHITYGVATLGLRYDQFKIEASSFTGREPDENRFDFDRPHFDSYSGRLTWNPGSNWSFQVSQGFIKSPENLHPGDDVYRTTASFSYALPLGARSFFNANGLWGLNRSHRSEHAALFELTYVRNRLALYGRYEWVQKSVHELDLDENLYTADVLFAVNALTLGMGYDAWQSRYINVSAGAQASVYKADNRLDPLYGRYPVSAQVYLRFYPPRMNTADMRMKM